MEIRLGSERRDEAIKEADRLNKALPLQLMAQDVEASPEFVHLLSSLSKHITDKGVGIQTHKDLVQAQDVLHHEKHSWLLQHILYRELQELVIDYEINAQEVSLTSDDKQFMTILQQCLTHAEIASYLDFSPDPTSKAQLLGLSEEDVQRHNHYRKHVPSLQQKLIPEIEDRLRKKCEKLVTFHQPSKPTDSTRLTLSKAVQLPGEIKASKHRLGEEKKQLHLFQHERDKQFWLYYQTLLDMLSVLEKLLKEYKLTQQVETNLVNSEWLIARCDAMCYKIRLVELEILCDTYTADTVQALDKVRKHLDLSIEDNEKDLIKVGQALQAYQAVGMGFDKLVEEYSHLKAELDNKQWALAELEKTSNI